MYALILSDNVLTSSFLSRGLKYENVYSLPVSFHHFQPSSINVNDFDCAVIKLDVVTQTHHSLLQKILLFLKNKPVYLIKRNNLSLSLQHENIIETTEATTMRQLAYDMKNRLDGFIRKHAEKTLQVSDLLLYPHKRSAYRFEHKIALRNKEFHLLEFLMRNTNMVLSRQKILEHVWDRNARLFTNTVDVHINILRKKLDYKDGFKLIETIHCHGYFMHPTPFA
ncbi:hypothetical protein GF369_03790 [Candidatus Peregrinibacteria bacterium]|nr:hypothetical protein [Candidatus Peregrinibacteria bacterium]